MMTIEIRFAKRNEAEKIAQFVSAVANQHIGPELSDDGLQTLLESMNPTATQERMDEGWPHFLALDRTSIAGVVVIKPPTHLYHFFVRTDLQRQGIGTKLLVAADDWSLQQHTRKLATVNASQNAIPVYHRFGFRTDGEVTEKDGVRYQPMIRIERT